MKKVMAIGAGVTAALVVLAAALGAVAGSLGSPGLALAASVTGAAGAALGAGLAAWQRVERGEDVGEVLAGTPPWDAAGTQGHDEHAPVPPGTRPSA